MELERIISIIKKDMPKYKKVSNAPAKSINCFITGAVINAESPNPPTVNPIAKPPLSGNHFAEAAMGTPYIMPTPVPAITPYIKVKVLIFCEKEAAIHPIPTRIPPKNSVFLGPNFCIKFPEKGIAKANIAKNIMNGKLL